MKINQAAELAGITSKNIRFYEDQGLIAPARDASNGYRDYSMENVEQLCRIKLLRMLGISCENIRRLQSGELDFDIVNIGLHFFLKDVRPMLPPVMNHSIAVA